MPGRNFSESADLPPPERVELREVGALADLCVVKRDLVIHNADVFQIIEEYQ